MRMPIVKVCFSPMLYPLYASKESVTVVVDILRATSAICTAFQHGIAKVIPVPEVDDTYFYKNNEDCIIAAERGGEIVEGFTFGNSPFSYMGPEIKGKTLVITTTNGTQAIEASKDSDIILIGSFSNFSLLTEQLAELQKDVMILCAGWKNRFNLEDTLFAGGVVDYLRENGFDYALDSDAAIASLTLFQAAKSNPLKYLKDSSHSKRLQRLHLDRDVEYCLTYDTAPVLPYLKTNYLTNAMHDGGLVKVFNQKISVNSI
jgi:2-phosphosulfolactate phosphatase